MRSADPAHAVGTTSALIAAGTGLAFGTSFLLERFAPGSPRDLRVPLAYVALAAPLLVAFRADISVFGFRRSRLGIAVISGSMLALAALLAAGKWITLSSGPTTDRAVALLAFTIVASIEEGMFRGVFQAQLVSWLGRWRGLLVGAACFSLWHLPQRLLTGVSGVDLAASLILVFLVGIVLGLFMLAVRNAVGPAILHTALDWVDRL